MSLSKEVSLSKSPLYPILSIQVSLYAMKYLIDAKYRIFVFLLKYINKPGIEGVRGDGKQATKSKFSVEW